MSRCSYAGKTVCRLIWNGLFSAGLGVFGPIKHSNFRLICATQKALLKLVKQGRFPFKTSITGLMFFLFIVLRAWRQDDLAFVNNTLLKTSISERKGTPYRFRLTNTKAIIRVTSDELSNLLIRADHSDGTPIYWTPGTIQECLDIDKWT